MSEAAIRGTVSKENLDNSEIVKTEQMGIGSQFHQSPRNGVGDRLFPTYGNTSDKNVLIRRCL